MVPRTDKAYNFGACSTQWVGWWLKLTTSQSVKDVWATVGRPLGEKTQAPHRRILGIVANLQHSLFRLGPADRNCIYFGDPKTIRVDQGFKFVSRDLDLRIYTDSVLDISR
jgi:hypothetical protein